MREIRTSGSVGGWGEESPRSTRRSTLNRDSVALGGGGWRDHPLLERPRFSNGTPLFRSMKQFEPARGGSVAQIQRSPQSM
jgi:hypothetical protein